MTPPPPDDPPPPDGAPAVNAAENAAPPAPPEDKYAYRIAIGALGAALVAFLFGAAWIASGGKPVPTQYWSTGSAIAGAIMGILAPTPVPRYKETQNSPAPKPAGFLQNVIAPVVDIWKNRSLFILLLVFGTSLGFSVANNSAPLQTVAAAAGGALVGMLAPPPTKQSG
jgi:hypothetical protein